MAESSDDIPTEGVQKPFDGKKGDTAISDGEDLFGNVVEATNESLPTTIQKSSAIPRKRAMEAPQPVVVDHPPTQSVAAYGMPDGVRIPSSVQSDLLQGRLLAALKLLPVQLINDALMEYDDAMTQKGHKIRNSGAYLYGVIKRYSAVAERGDGLSMGPELTPIIHKKLDQMLLDGFCTQEEMNEKVKSKIRMLSEKDAIFAIDEFSGVNRSQIRDFGSYFMGILNRYMRGDMKARDNSKLDDRRGRSNSNGQYEQRDRGGHKGRTPDQNKRILDDRGRSRFSNNDPLHREDRDRSRDQKDEHYGPNRNRPPQNLLDHYDPRRASQFAGGVPPPPPQRPTYSQQIPQVPYQQQQPVYGVLHDGVPHPQYHHFQDQHQPPHRSFVTDQQQSSYMTQPTMGVQQALPQMMMNQPPHVMMNQQQQPQPMSNNPANMQHNWQSSAQQQSSAPPDILGIADKAAQALAAAMGHLASHTPQPSPQQLQPPLHGTPHQMQAPLHGTPQQIQPPVHGMLHPQHGMLQQQQQIVGTPYRQPFPQQHVDFSMNGLPGYTQQQAPQPQNVNHSFNSNSQPNPKRRRTLAQMQELSVNVQHAVQNLHLVGAIDSALDEGMLGMIKDLPEPLALQSLQKFSSMDRSTMRNKTAYLAGLLRTELAKINLR